MLDGANSKNSEPEDNDITQGDPAHLCFQDPPRLTIDLDIGQSDFCTLHLRYLISDRNELHFSAPFNNPDNSYSLIFCDDRLRAIVKHLLNINGVASFVVSPYKITLEKSGAYDWCEIFVQVEQVIARFYGISVSELLISLRTVYSDTESQIQVEQD